MAHNTAEFDQLVNNLLEKWKVPGLSLAIVKGNEIETKCYGNAKFHGNPCNTDTIFDLASTSKIMTAAAVACLVDDENYPDVQWTTPVSKLLPDDFVMQDPQLTKEITIEDILSHRTGIARHDNSYLSQRAKNPDNAQSITRNLRNLPVEKPLRTGWIYSNIMFSVATHLVETVSGEKYVNFLRKRLWVPLGMTNTFHDIPDIEAHAATHKQAVGHTWDEEQKQYITITSGPEPEGQGAGCIWSSAGDYAKWIRAMLKQESPLSKDAHKELITPRMIVPEPDEIPFYSDLLYALGIQRESYRGRLVISHDGGVDGFRAKVGFLPQMDWGIVMFGNAENAFYVQQHLLHVLMDDLLDVPAAERVDWAAFFHGWWEKAEADDKKNEEDPEFQRPDVPEPLEVPLESLVGTYHDAGYKDLVLEMKDGGIVADCTDRCYPFMLTFEHLTGTKFVVNAWWVRVGQKGKMKGGIRSGEGGIVTAIGVGFDSDLKDQLIWFERVL